MSTILLLGTNRLNGTDEVFISTQNELSNLNFSSNKIIQIHFPQVTETVVQQKLGVHIYETVSITCQIIEILLMRVDVLSLKSFFLRLQFFAKLLLHFLP